VAEAPVGALDEVLRALETLVRSRAPRIEFYFGDLPETERQKSPPSITWIVERAPASAETRDRPETDTRSWMDDLVEVRARCVGLVPQGQRSQAFRRQQLEASMQVFLALSWAVTCRHQGAYEDRGWVPVNPAVVSDAHVPIDFTFALRVARMEPAWDQTQFQTFDETVTLES